MAFLHGVETVESRIGARSVTVVKSAVIGIVSVAPKGTLQTLIQVQTEQDAAQFGIAHPDNYLRNAITNALLQGPCTLIAVNVFDDGDHTETVTAETHTIRGGKIKLNRLYIESSESLEVSTTGGSPVTLVLDTDYTYDGDTQTITLLPSSTYVDGFALACEYLAMTQDLTDIADADIVGTVSGATRTGYKLFDLLFPTFGYNARIYISPYFSHRPTVATEMLRVAVKFRGHCILDAVAGATLAQVRTGRGDASGTVKNFYTSSRHAILVYPSVKAANPYAGDSLTYDFSDITLPLSAMVAGLISATDNSDGYWYSPSNRVLAGVLGVVVKLTWQLNDPTCEVNGLNEIGVCSIAAGFGTGYRFWGNRSAQYPTDTYPDNFIAVYRTGSVISESLELAMLPFIDLPLNAGQIDAIVATGNEFIRTLVGRNALAQGSRVFYDPSENPAPELALGHLTISVEYMVFPATERITFLSRLNPALLASLNA